jgi:hypothetical protein
MSTFVGGSKKVVFDDDGGNAIIFDDTTGKLVYDDGFNYEPLTPLSGMYQKAASESNANPATAYANATAELTGAAWTFTSGTWANLKSLSYGTYWNGSHICDLNAMVKMFDTSDFNGRTAVAFYGYLYVLSRSTEYAGAALYTGPTDVPDAGWELFSPACAAYASGGTGNKRASLSAPIVLDDYLAIVGVFQDWTPLWPTSNGVIERESYCGYLNQFGLILTPE